MSYLFGKLTEQRPNNAEHEFGGNAEKLSAATVYATFTDFGVRCKIDEKDHYDLSF